MGKRLRILLPFLFLTCLVLGYLTNRYFLQISSSGVARVTITPLPTLPNQRNFLVIIVDDLSAYHPEIQALWALILYYPQHKFIFQPLSAVALPEKNLPDYVNIRAGNDKISSDFLQQASLAYHIPWQDYLVLDTTALSFLSRWAQVANPSNTGVLEISAGKVFIHICNRLQGSTEALVDLMGQQSQIPEHFHSSLTLETALEIQRRLEIAPDSSLECQVFEP